MKRYAAEWIALAVQFLLFYGYPLVGLWDPIGMVILILCATAALSFLLGLLSGSRARFAYPAVVSAAFLPSVWIYYNETAMVHSLWYLVVSSVGLALGAILRKLCTRK